MNLRAVAMLLLLGSALAGCGRVAGPTMASHDKPSSVAASLQKIPGFGGLEPGDVSRAHLSREDAIRVARAGGGLFAHGPTAAEYVVPEDANARLNAGSDGPVWAVTVGGLHISPDEGGAPPPPPRYVSTALMLIADRTGQETILTFCD